MISRFTFSWMVMMVMWWALSAGKALIASGQEAGVRVLLDLGATQEHSQLGRLVADHASVRQD
jgi:hypothetical protein